MSDQTARVAKLDLANELLKLRLFQSVVGAGVELGLMS